jgi:hypothetical protein
VKEWELTGSCTTQEKYDKLINKVQMETVKGRVTLEVCRCRRDDNAKIDIYEKQILMA